MRENLARLELYDDAPTEKQEVNELPPGWPSDANVEKIIADDAFAKTEQSAKGEARLTREDFTEEAIAKKRAELLQTFNGGKEESAPAKVIYPEVWKVEPHLQTGEMYSTRTRSEFAKLPPLELVPEPAKENSEPTFEFKNDKFPEDEDLLPEHNLAGDRYETFIKPEAERLAEGDKLRRYFEQLRGKEQAIETKEASPALVKPKAERDADRIELQTFFKGRNGLANGEKPEEIKLDFDQNKQKPKVVPKGFARFIPAFARRLFGR